jgi:hypothetical protein
MELPTGKSTTPQPLLSRIYGFALPNGTILNKVGDLLRSMKGNILMPVLQEISSLCISVVSSVHGYSCGVHGWSAL